MTTKIFLDQIDIFNATAGQTVVVGSQGLIFTSSFAGYVGSAGGSGYLGSAGFQGSLGDVGSPGDVGYQGSAGFNGSRGDTGFAGSIGTVGYNGSAGFQGSVGFQGSEGNQGGLGDLGYQGSQGNLGPVGYRGSLGSVTPFTFVSGNLSDVPGSYSGANGYIVRVNTAANALEFAANYITNNISSNVDFNSSIVRAPQFLNISEKVYNVGNTGASQTIYLANGNIHTLTLNTASVAISLSNTGLASSRLHSITLFITQDASGSRTIDWSTNTIKWPSVGQPVLSTTANLTDIITLFTTNAGTNWYGVSGGTGFA